MDVQVEGRRACRIVDTLSLVVKRATELRLLNTPEAPGVTAQTIVHFVNNKKTVVYNYSS